jgi:hypothetical protein
MFSFAAMTHFFEGLSLETLLTLKVEKSLMCLVGTLRQTNNIRNTRDIRKAISGELLQRQAMRKKLLYKKYVHTEATCQRSVVGTEALAVSGNTFLYACVKEICRLTAQPRFATFQ